VRHLLTESLLLAGLGGVVGVAVARVGLAGLVAASPPSLAGVASAGIDGAALGAAFVLTTLVGLLFGLAPALAAEGNLPEATRETSRGSMGSRSARHVLVVVEVALAMVLLVGAGLLLRSTQRLFSQPTGFDASGLVVMQVQGTGLEHGDAATHRFFDGALEAVRSVPGVSSAVMTNQLPLSGAVDVYGVTLADGREGESVDGAAYRYAVAPGYFETMGIPSLRGRQLERGDDADAPPVAVVSESLARRMFPAGEAVGGRIYIGAQEDPPYTIVGVVADVKQASLDANDGDAVYVPSHQWHWADRVRWIAVRADRGAAAGLVPALRRAVWSVDRNQPITGAQSMDELVARSESQRRFVLLVLMAFALAALGLAGIGLYGVLSGTVTERMRELGVRAALGASRGNILGLVLRQGMVLTGLGAGIGVVVAAAASEVLVTLLFGVTRLDVVTYVSVAGALGLVAALACWLPAARAAGVDPLTTLRAE
jgi:putative ABC transport system permease protein